MNEPTTTTALDPEASVRQRYSVAAQQVEAALCCSVNYSRDPLAAIPPEIVEKDYGCGDPTPYVRPGETVVDLGSGAGKLCYILAQIVGPAGRVVGVDCNVQMLAVARKHVESFSRQIGYANLEFRCGLIQDLALDLDALDRVLAERPVASRSDWLDLRSHEERLRREAPLIASESVDCVVSNCVLNLVRPAERDQLLREVFRVLKPGGRIAISDIVADEEVPPHLKADPTLWSGCVSGAYYEEDFPRVFQRAGFHGIQIVQRQTRPWRTVEGIEFRSLTLLAFKGQSAPDVDRNQAVIYRGPFPRVVDEEGQVFERGVRTAVSDRTFRRLGHQPYVGLFDLVEPLEPVPFDCAPPFIHPPGTRRPARETKGAAYRATSDLAAACCADGGDAL